MTSLQSLDVGFIGLGDQGCPMAQAITERGFPLHVWARRPRPTWVTDPRARVKGAFLEFGVPGFVAGESLLFTAEHLGD
ncbi:NAD(P)-binding domain-containing protein [Deinococcus oregonensis]|uniref:NAD(P)-binding domain-containing protein n=1 Tax=Deinococcus oregonensis TaxID=1805970 RepID=A0ABV6AXE5_9DEIO